MREAGRGLQPPSLSRLMAERLSPSQLLRLACAPVLALSLAGARPATVTCPVSGLAETTAELSLTRTAGRIDSFSYSMHRPVNWSAHECDISASRGHPESRWSDSKSQTLVRVAPAIAGDDRIVSFTPRQNGVRMAFLSPTHCGTFRLPPVVEFRWTKRGCAGRAIGWPGAGRPGSFNRQ